MLYFLNKIIFDKKIIYYFLNLLKFYEYVFFYTFYLFSYWIIINIFNIIIKKYKKNQNNQYITTSDKIMKKSNKIMKVIQLIKYKIK